MLVRVGVRAHAWVLVHVFAGVCVCVHFVVPFPCVGRGSAGSGLVLFVFALDGAPVWHSWSGVGGLLDSRRHLRVASPSMPCCKGAV